MRIFFGRANDLTERFVIAVALVLAIGAFGSVGFCQSPEPLLAAIPESISETLPKPEFAPNKQALLVTGDSWAVFMCYEGSFEASFIKHNVNANVICGGASKFGAKASVWSTYPASQKTNGYLKKYPGIKVVYLSIGGNDFFDAWNKDLSATDEETRFKKIVADTKAVINQILTLRPDVKVLLSGYDYGNFKHYSKILKFYTEMYTAMGNPTTAQVQEAVVRLSNMMSTLADNDHVFYIQHYGLSQYYYGNPDYNLKPRHTKSPDEISPPSDPNATGGIVQEEAPVISLLNILGLQDAYHPSPFEFYNMAEHNFSHYLKFWLK